LLSYTSAFHTNLSALYLCDLGNNFLELYEHFMTHDNFYAHFLLMSATICIPFHDKWTKPVNFFLKKNQSACSVQNSSVILAQIVFWEILAQMILPTCSPAPFQFSGHRKTNKQKHTRRGGRQGTDPPAWRRTRRPGSRRPDWQMPRIWGKYRNHGSCLIRATLQRYREHVHLMIFSWIFLKVYLSACCLKVDRDLGQRDSVLFFPWLAMKAPVLLNWLYFVTLLVESLQSELRVSLLDCRLRVSWSFACYVSTSDPRETFITLSRLNK
jgi:hypothetical protein